MILSMTGFGRAEGIFEGKKISIELKSLNSKSFDLNLRIPLRYKEKEFEVRKLLNDTILRGKVDCYINCETIDDCNDVKINQDIVKAYMNQLREISPNAEEFEYLKMAIRMIRQAQSQLKISTIASLTFLHFYAGKQTELLAIVLKFHCYKL